MQIISAVLIAILLLVVVIAVLRRGKPSQPSGGNAANTDGELESLYSLLGDNSGRVQK